MQRGVNGQWPAIFLQRKPTRDEGMKLEKVLWEMIFLTDECTEVYGFLQMYFRMCTNINNDFPVRPWFDDPDEEGQKGSGYRDDMMAQFKKDLYNKNSTFQDQAEDDGTDTLENRNKFWLKILSTAQGPVPDNLYD